MQDDRMITYTPPGIPRDMAVVNRRRGFQDPIIARRGVALCRAALVAAACRRNPPTASQNTDQNSSPNVLDDISQYAPVSTGPNTANPGG